MPVPATTSMFPPAATTIVVGPSHVVRWQHARISPPGFVFIGAGGAPVWDRDLRDALLQQAGPQARVVLLLDDVRFGNSLAADAGSNELAEGDVFLSGFRGIIREYIDPQIDAALQLRTDSALRWWRNQFGDRLRIIPWSLLLRPIERAKRTSTLGGPVWALDGVSDDPTIRAIDMRPLAADPALLQRLFIDANLHPSPLGHRLLQALASWASPAVAAATASQGLVATLQQAVSPHLHLTLLCGNARAVALLAESDAFRSGSVIALHLGSADLAAVIRRKTVRSVVFLTDTVPTDDVVSWRLAVKERLQLPPDVTFTLHPWALHARQIVARRHADLEHLALTRSESDQLAQLECCNASPGLGTVLTDLSVDLGEELSPTEHGLADILRLLT